MNTSTVLASLSLLLVVGCTAEPSPEPKEETESALSVHCIDGVCTTRDDAAPSTSDVPAEDDAGRGDPLADRDAWWTPSPGTGGSQSIRCTNGSCSCAAGPKTGVACIGSVSGTPTSCDRVCAY